MKRTYKLFAQIAAIAVALSFGFRAHAEPPREELGHAYILLKSAKHDYKGHRDKAIHHLEQAAHELGIDFKGGHATERELQLQSDDQVAAAKQMLADVRNKMEAHDRERIAVHLDKAIEEVDLALKAR